MTASGTPGSHSTSSRVIRLFLSQPLDVIRSIRSSYSSNNEYLSTRTLCTMFVQLNKFFERKIVIIFLPINLNIETALLFQLRNKKNDF